MKADRKAYQDQKQVQKLGNQRGDGSTGNAHSGGTQLSEDEQIVQPGVRRYRAKTCPKGDSGVFLAAQPCGQDGADRHGQIRERHDAEVPRPHTEDGVICRIKSQDLRREAQCTGRPEAVRQQIAAARLRLICARRGYQLNA